MSHKTTATVARTIGIDTGKNTLLSVGPLIADCCQALSSFCRTALPTRKMASG